MVRDINMKNVNLLLIGVGPHAMRIYIPALFRLAADYPIRLVAAVDLKRQTDTVDTYLKDQKYDLEMLFLDSFNTTDGIPKHSMTKLDALVNKFNIQGVVISTEPTAHKVYAEWALRKGLHILMDKPITARKEISVDRSQAKDLIDDYDELMNLYKLHQINRKTIFSINVQRRYEYGFDKVREMISETAKKFNVPVTSMQIMHADGSWRFPQEVLTQESHGLKDGFGKVAHSGYHMFDMAWQMYQSGLIEDKKPDQLEIFSSPLTPSGLSLHLNEKDYIRYFGSEFKRTGLSSKEYLDKISRYGEMDSFSIIRLLRDGENICNISVNLLHSSFSRRSWSIPNADLYKGNGRVKHQQFIIQQGPFQCIQIHNYQSKHQHDVDNSDEFEVGGNNHFDIYVFRNVGMFGEGKAFTKISARDFEKDIDVSLLTNENAKDRAIVEFIKFVLGQINISDVKSNIDTHAVSVKMMSGVCQSSANIRSNKNPLIRISI
jgi:hypothetical protein